MDFSYEAVGKDGRTFTGVIEAGSQAEAMRVLREQELTPVTLVLASVTAGAAKSNRRQRSASRDSLVIALRELATLLQAGVTLAESVESMASAHAATQLGEAFGSVHSQLRAGTAFSEALRSSALALPEYVYQLSAAGELTGKLAQSLQSAAEQMEYEQRVRKEMVNALVYPCILVLSGLAATLLIFIVVVPRFTNLLKNGKAQLPEISVWVLKSGLFVKENLLWFGLGALGLALLAAVLGSSSAFRRGALNTLARAPLLGDWLHSAEIGRWSTMLGTLLANRVAIMRAMELAAASVQIDVIANRLSLVERDVRAGKKLAESLAFHRTVSAMGVNLVRVGERTGELPEMLKTMGRIYADAGRERMKRFLVLLEPITILLVGCAIGFIMIAIMLAITSLSTQSL
ncbi:type II secretion system F family protein [Paucibacter sp. APW11]|uniref:Type II secretion system F family protein n=1 Tax=Roseateles aquae TaxID=3077235 RepID=A0ABU3PF67_9BURK|nr:type II secretion system F family protein [Paucibacter sp. APW11]MDT9001245.1 type II secretion system F family protein [Paucibacter sp. APW11]